MLKIAILKDTKKDTLDKWIKSLPMEIQNKIIGISTDMNKGYKNVFESNIPKVLSTVDKYHLAQEVNRMMDEVRQLNNRLIQSKIIKEEEIIKHGKVPKKVLKIKEVKKVKDEIKSNKYKDKKDNIVDEKYILEKDLLNAKGEKIDYKEITLNYFLNVGYRKLFLKREENLSGIQKLRLRQIFREFDYKGYMVEAWIAKERFLVALDELDINEIVGVMKDCLISEHYRIRIFGGTLKRRMKQLETFCKYSTKEFKFTNAYTEVFNNHCKVAKRVSYGFKYKNNYLRKLSAKFCYKRN